MYETPQAPSTPQHSMNSELIRQKFGSYGVDVLIHNNNVRLSSLYSLDAATKITRTVALVQFVPESTERFSDEHDAVINGASIGATFADAGWQIRKPLRAVYQLPVRDSYSSLYTAMSLERAQALSMHIYDFVVAEKPPAIDAATGASNIGRGNTYATIIEIHSPGYLSPQEVSNIAANVSPARSPERQPSLEHIEALLHSQLQALCAAL